MEIYETEEQQVEAIKSWWKANGLSVLLGAGLGIAGIVGWNYWKDSRVEGNLEAATAYSEVATKISGVEPDTDGFVSAAESFLQEHPDTGYALLTRLQLARVAVDEADFDSAESHLRAALAEKEFENFQPIVTVRLARVLIQNGKAEEALALVDTAPFEGVELNYLVTKADALMALGRKSEAYAALKAASEIETRLPYPGLDLMLDDLASEEQ